MLILCSQDLLRIRIIIHQLKFFWSNDDLRLMLVLKKDIQFLAAIWKATQTVTKTNIRPMSSGLDCKHYLVMYNTIRNQNRSIKDTELSTIHASHCSTRFFNYLKNRNNLLMNMIKIVAYFQFPQVSLITAEVIGLC